MHSVAQAWLILSLTNSPLLLGLINLLHWGPILLLAIPSGAIADRVVTRRQRTTTIRQDIVEGVAYALRTPEIRAVLAVLFVISFCTFNFSMWVPLMATNVLGQDAQGLGFLMSAVGVGAVFGALTLGSVV